MVDCLCLYNLCDVDPIAKAVTKMFDMLEAKFDVNPLLQYGLPSFGFKAMMKSFPIDEPSVVSFPYTHNHLSVMFRKNIVGGITKSKTQKESLCALNIMCCLGSKCIHHSGATTCIFQNDP